MLAHSLFLLLMVASADVHTVTIECPGITCRSRFSESLEEHIVQANGWVHSLNITYIDKPGQENQEPVWGDTARLTFTIDRNRHSSELTLALIESGRYYGTDAWTLVERISLSKLKKAEPKDLDTKALGINIPDKVTEVFWSVQSEACTVQVSFQSLPDGEKQPEHPQTQVWLLKSDGTAIAYLQEPQTIGTSMAGHTTESTIYSFPTSAKVEAVAVVVSIDNKFFTKRLNASGE